MTMIDQREWSKLFPLDTNTFDGSTLFIQRLFTVTLSALTAKRRIFSDEHFSTKKLGRLNVPLFTRPESIIEKQRFTKTVFSWIQGVSQAISKNYLKLATFFVISKSDDSVLEMYEYYFDYKNSQIDEQQNESFSSSTTTDDIQQQVLKSLELIDQFIDEHIEPIRHRENYRFSLKIEYNNPITPIDYQPTGFVDSQQIVSPIDWKRILTTKTTSSRRILAQIKTSHHKMLLVFRQPTLNISMKKSYQT